MYVNVDMTNGQTATTWVDSLQAAFPGVQVWLATFQVVCFKDKVAMAKHRIFCQNLNPGISGKFWRSFLVKLAKKARLIVGSLRFVYKNPVLKPYWPLLVCGRRPKTLGITWVDVLVLNYDSKIWDRGWFMWLARESCLKGFFIKPHSHPNGFYWGQLMDPHPIQQHVMA